MEETKCKYVVESGYWYIEKHIDGRLNADGTKTWRSSIGIWTPSDESICSLWGSTDEQVTRYRGVHICNAERAKDCVFFKPKKSD